ncbi:E3 ubiquitin-protein ligase MARCHF6 isoform X2 [Cloeon dipterum]|uniref:E3 ubiquitin-protein ligase MARCHF6 isoform X2 n=1 Tax=Cloeon dipterum TaxID=197152 RepID=UPI00322081C3
MMSEDDHQADICRVCRCEGCTERPLFYPCICTGSIKYIHQECLVQWMRYSRKEYCELCGYRFSFTPIYSPDMPRRLPFRDVAAGLLSSVATAVKHWCHYTIVALAWLGIVPLTACRIYRCLFTGSVHSVLTLPLDLLSMDNLAADILHGCLVVTCTLFAFLSLVWLREQILHGGGPDWLEQELPADPIPEPDPGLPEVDLAGGAGPVEGIAQMDAEVNQQQPDVQDNAPAQADQQEEAGGDGNDLDGGDDGNWNPMEWNAAGEELTWERLLGLDGSLVFLEHVFWVVSLNTLFVLIFAFFPYHIGNYIVMGITIGPYVAASHFDGLVTTLVGYCAIGVILVLLHAISKVLQLRKICRGLGLCYVVVKVSLLCVVEVGVLPLVCGWWLDICSLNMFDATLKDRETSFRQAPGTSLFIHWLVGMVYVYYFASFVLLLREVLRPGVLWFLRNLNDPDFSPIQEMIHMSVALHVRRLLMSAVIFGTAVLLMLWLPVHLLKMLFPGFLPYVVTLSTAAAPVVQNAGQSSLASAVFTGDPQVSPAAVAHEASPTHGSELSLELLLLQVVLPALLEQSHTRSWLKASVRLWCVAVSWLLGLRSYLLGDEEDRDQNGEDSFEGDNEEEEEQNLAENRNNLNFDGDDEQDEGVEENANDDMEWEDVDPLDLGAAHQQQALLHRDQSNMVGNQPYHRPGCFVARLVGLLLVLAISLVVASVVVLTVPVWIGRRLLSLIWIRQGESMAVHELYTAAAGTYMCWASARFVAFMSAWAPRGRVAVGKSLRRKLATASKSVVAAIVLLGLVPLLFGTLLEAVVVVPLRVPLHQTPVLCAWQDWALGVLYTKIACAVTLMGPNWWLKAALERAYRDGLRELDLVRVMRELAAPVLMGFGLALAVPYILSQSIVPLFVTNPSTKVLLARRIYPFLLLASLCIGAGAFQVRQFRRLYEHIKNDKYLVGRRLVNYDQRKKQKAQSTAH